MNDKFVVFDLDGTIADDTHRKKFLLRSPKKWDEYFDACHLDKPIHHIIHLVKMYKNDGYKVHIWTGRKSSKRSQTLKWLSKYGLENIPLVMRPEGNRIDDFVLKQQWMKKYGKPSIVFEDRDRMVKMWRSIHIPCMQVRDGNF